MYLQLTAMAIHNFVTIADLSREKILYMIKLAQEFEKHPNREILKGKVVATLFLNRPRVRDLVLKQQPIALERV